MGYFLDMSKAYDRVSHDWLRLVISRAGFGPFISSCIDKIYNSATSKILVNNASSSSVRLGRGVRQGDALSCYLFLLTIAPLDHFIHKHPDILPLIEVENNLCKALLYADDTALLLSVRSEMAAVHSSLKLYCMASNAKLNTEKSNCICIGEARAENTRFPELKADEHIKYLGIPFSRHGLAHQDAV